MSSRTDSRHDGGALPPASGGRHPRWIVPARDRGGSAYLDADILALRAALDHIYKLRLPRDDLIVTKQPAGTDIRKLVADYRRRTL